MDPTPRSRRPHTYEDSPLPRMPARFPQTPPSTQHSRHQDQNVQPKNRPEKSPQRSDMSAPSSEDITKSKLASNYGPAIPVTVLDPAQQRLYAVTAFALLQAWKLYDLGRLYNDQDDSISELWFILKWLMLDGLFLNWLPLLRIPWLTFTTQVTIIQILFLGAINIFLSLQYQVSLQLVLVGLWKKLYNREISVSERRVKVNDIVFNSSHILGKHTLHYLPEGSAKINPENLHYCLGPDHQQIFVPIRVNSTLPSLIQISQQDFTTSERHILNITQKEIKRMMKASPRNADPRIHLLQYPVKNPGLYKLQKVVDISNLVVRVYRSEALVVDCPSANFQVTHETEAEGDRCRGDLSNMSLGITGLPPLQVKYSRHINKDEKGVTIESVAPEDYESPLLKRSASDQKVAFFGGQSDMKWADKQYMKISLNESLASAGTWMYRINEIRDGLGNVVHYTTDNNEVKPENLRRLFNVHERPQAKFKGCDPQHPLRVPRGSPGGLPIEITGDAKSPPYEITYAFTPFESLKGSTEHMINAETRSLTIKSALQQALTRDPGLYTLQTVASKFCNGEVLESSSCLFLTPPDPDLSIAVDEILDKCAGFSIGLTIDLTLVGTPPFVIRYRIVKDKKEASIHSLRVDGTRHQLRLTPAAAGHYTYEFFSLDDAVYSDVALNSKELRAKQRVIPPAGASFVPSSPAQKCCIGESVSFDVNMQGSGPWKLNYELIHAGKRTKFSEENITSPHYTIQTAKFTNGGEYTLALTTVEDSHGCKIFLESEAYINVRRQRPKASFGEIEGHKSVKALEGGLVRIPLRLAGEKPFMVSIKHEDSTHGAQTSEVYIKNHNDFLEVRKNGRYEIVQVRDANCPGLIGENPSTFDVDWIAKPSLDLKNTPAIQERGNKFVRNAICEGDEDAVEVIFSGSPPFKATYEQTFHGKRAEHKSLQVHDLKAGVNVANIRMDASRAGLYQYKFLTLSDGLYDKHNLQSMLLLEQTVHSKPSARFQYPGKVYKYCLEAGVGDDVIPIVLEGASPFSLDIRIKHYTTGKTENVHVPNIDGHLFQFRVPSYALTLGSHAISLAQIRDSRDCTTKASQDTGHVVVAVADLPTITALDNKPYYCVGDRITYSLAGIPPFIIEYNFEGKVQRANTPATFQRIAERPGNFTITGIKDSASECKVTVNSNKMIHAIPSVRVSEGAQIVEGIHEGDQAEINFDFSGTPPFTFTYTRSEIAKKGAKAKILEMHTQTTESYTHSIFASLEGTYEVISIQDRYCGFSAKGATEDTSKLIKMT